LETASVITKEQSPQGSSPAPLNDQAARELEIGDARARAGDVSDAIRHYLAAVELSGGAAICHCRAGGAYWKQRNLPRAMEHFQLAARVDPTSVQAHEALGELYSICGDSRLALQYARRGAELVPNDPEMALSLAAALQVNRQPEAAAQIIDALHRAGYRSVRLAMMLAGIAQSTGRKAEALAEVERFLQEGKFQFTGQAVVLHFAAASLLDQMGRYDEAFAHAREGKRVSGAKYNPQPWENQADESISYFTRRRVSSLPRATHESRLPVFIVGMPRSGTSLIEQIVASHPSVFGAGELQRLTDVAFAAGQRAFGQPRFRPNCLQHLSINDVENLAAQYLEPLKALAPGARRITDKMPMNFLYLGLIAVLFPEARIIHCQRDPRDTAISCMMSNFLFGHEFTADFQSFGHFYKQYERLMSHWKTVLNLPILEVRYEELVKDLEGQSRRMIQFLGMPWDDRCLKFHENERLVATASMEQVRQPLYSTSVGRWRHYEKHLAPLAAALGWG